MDSWDYKVNKGYEEYMVAICLVVLCGDYDKHNF